MTRLWAAIAAGAAIVAVCLLAAQQPKKTQPKKAAQRAAVPLAAEAADLRLGPEITASRATDPGKQSDWPALACGREGTLWLAFIEWNDKDADRVMVRRKRPGGEWSAPVALDDGNWDHYAPAIVARGDGALAVWSAQVDGNFELYAAHMSASGDAAKPERLTRAPHGDFNVVAAADAQGNVTIAWQSFREGNSDIRARKLTGDRWGREVRLSPSDAGDWEPAIALDSRGVAWISWDSYHHGNYDVFLRSFDGDKLGPVIPITTEPSAQFHSSVAVDGEDRVWVAWDDGGINWGKDFSRSSAAPGSQGLHHSRSIGMRVYAAGRVQQPDAGVAGVLTGRMRQFAELPHLSFDGSGALWMVFRHWTYARPNEVYHFYATGLSGGEWSLPQRLAMSAGHNSQKASLARTPDGRLVAAYASDGRSPTVTPSGDQAHALHYNAYVVELPVQAGPPKVALDEITLPAPGWRSPRRPRHTMRAGGRNYTLMLGDCHRHTDIRGHSGVDGSVLDTYRYAIDAAQLDFLGTADHNEVLGGRWPDGLRDYQWWWTQKAVDLFTHEPVFVGIYSYEHSMARPAGHRNILFLRRGAPLRMIDRERRDADATDNLPPALWRWIEENPLKQPGQKLVIVPHTFAAGPLADWKWPNARFDCLLEIYQGCRGSYEKFRLPDNEKRGPTQVDDPGHYAQDALDVGNVYGFVSFSDHGSTHNSWAGVWVLSEDRRGIIDGMYDRRTYAASDEIILKVTAGGRMVGEEFETPAGRAPRLEAVIDAPDTILRVDVVKDGRYVYTTRPSARRARLTWRDADATKAGRSYYYLRVFQRDAEAPEGDPEIAWSSPWFVTYR
jgi:hypothetical protein